MKSQRRASVVSFLLLCALSRLYGADRASAAYEVQGDVVDGGGGLQSSSNYVNHGAIGDLSAVVASGAYTNRNAHVVRLFLVVARELVASPPTVDEDATRQVSARAVLDDASRLALNAGSFAWSVLSGPAMVNAQGLVQGQAVYEDTPVELQAVDGDGAISTMLTVLDTLPDNFGSYANDGLADGWQVLYFGLDNPDSAPSADPDGDGLSNLFEEIAGTSPTDASSRFHFEIQPHPELANRMQVQFSPRWNNRTYRLLWTHSLSGEPTWNVMPSGTVVEDDGLQRTVTDVLSGAPSRFYKLEIERD